jgi:hypothetical protein
MIGRQTSELDTDASTAAAPAKLGVIIPSDARSAALAVVLALLTSPPIKLTARNPK